MTPEVLLEHLLSKRGLHTAEARAQFLEPHYESLYDPYLMHDMRTAVRRIADAVANREMICIYSDYDADGIPGAVILHDFFKKIGYVNFWNYIPHRHTEGYGLHTDALLKIRERGTTLVITVDLGITAVTEVAFARELGMDVIITDHHEPLEVVPDAYAVVNPKLGNYPDRMLCGAGVAFKLVQALVGGVWSGPAKGVAHTSGEVPPFAGLSPTGWEKWLLDMAGIATLSDMVPLVNENRILAYYGMKVLKKTPRPGLQSLFQKSGISLQHLIEDDIVFSVTPRLNAASRMGHPDDAFKVLATDDRRTAVVAAEYLSSLNDDRKKTVAHIMKEVHARITKRKASGMLPNILVIGDPSWSAGVLGLVASKITETYQVTTFVWGSDDDPESSTGSVKGSCRGIGDVAVVELMQKTSEKLLHFGGHEDAGGFSASKEHVHFLEELWNVHYLEIKRESIQSQGQVIYDAELPLAAVTMNHYRSLRKLAPFGMANPKPVFAFTHCTIVSTKQFGKTKEHLEIVVTQASSKTDGSLPSVETTSMRAISWYAHSETFTKKIAVGDTITLIAEFDHSVFRGKEELRLRIKDVI